MLVNEGPVSRHGFLYTFLGVVPQVQAISHRHDVRRKQRFGVARGAVLIPCGGADDAPSVGRSYVLVICSIAAVQELCLSQWLTRLPPDPRPSAPRITAPGIRERVHPS